jgi:ABC-type sugar transport system ATPase subunit
VVIQLDGVGIRQGTFRLSNVHLHIPKTKTGVLLGPTGSGKTTLLEIIAGLRAPTAGTVILGDSDVTAWSPRERNIGYVPQDLALFPQATVWEHLAFPLMMRREARNEIQRRVAQLAESLAISGILHRLPEQLSGGEKQRVALGRALSAHPEYLLLDEPLSALDVSLRGELLELLKTLRETGRTTLYVTHRTDEADCLGDVVFRMHDGACAKVESR